MFDWDEEKRRLNREKHGVDFAEAGSIDWDRVVTRADGRGDYGEDRFVTYATIRGRLHVLVWTPRNGRIRVISLRRANPREEREHGGPQKLH